MLSSTTIGFQWLLLRAVYADVAAKTVDLRRQGMTHSEVCNELNRLATHPAG